MRKTQEEMKYFKLELMNREENFNKTFNRKPTIGVMSVVKSKGPGGPATIDATNKGLPPLGAGGLTATASSRAMQAPQRTQSMRVKRGSSAGRQRK